MKGFGTDNDGLIEVICRRTNAQRFVSLMNNIKIQTWNKFDFIYFRKSIELSKHATEKICWMK